MSFLVCLALGIPKSFETSLSIPTVSTDTTQAGLLNTVLDSFSTTELDCKYFHICVTKANRDLMDNFILLLEKYM